jgi:hypothetical protein
VKDCGEVMGDRDDDGWTDDMRRRWCLLRGPVGEFNCPS